MRDPDENGWDSSADAWTQALGVSGDFSREHVLDPLMLAQIGMGLGEDGQEKLLVDIGCGEGRFCRMAQLQGYRTIGIDPAPRMIELAKERDPDADYIDCFAEMLPFADQSVDLAVFYLSLIDIDDLDAAISEAARVLKPGGEVMVANLTSFTTSNGVIGYVETADGERYFPLGSYLEERQEWVEWNGIKVRNWHRPLSVYMQAFLKNGFELSGYWEPEPVSDDEKANQAYRQAPYLMAMRWRKASLD